MMKENIPKMNCIELKKRFLELPYLLTLAAKNMETKGLMHLGVRLFQNIFVH